MPQHITKELALADYSHQSREFWPLFKEVAELAETSRRDRWMNPSGGLTRADAIRLIEELSSALRYKADIDFPEAFVDEVTLSLPSLIGVNNIESVIKSVALQVVRHAHDMAQAERRSRISIPDALCVMHLLYDSVGMPVVKISGNSHILAYLTELMSQRIVNKSETNSSYASIAYSTWMGSQKISRNHVTPWQNSENKQLYYYLSKRRKKLKAREEIDSISEYDRAWTRMDKLKIPLKAIADSLISRISPIERQKILKHEFPRLILSDENFLLDRGEEYELRKRMK